MNNTIPHTLFLKLTSVLLLATCLVACDDISNKHGAQPVSAAQTTVQQGLVGAIFGKIMADKSQLDSAGFTAQDKQIPIQPNQYFALGSNGKSITALLAANMVESGLVQWNSRILDVLPELKNKIRDDYSEVTLEQLLDHRSGMIPLTSLEEAQAYDGDFPADPWELRLATITWMLNQNPIATPGTSFNYSNAGYTVVGAMLEKLGHNTYLNLVNEWVLAPLGISAIMAMPATKLAHQPIGHLGQNNHLTPVDPSDEQLLLVDNVIAPAGSLCMTAKDYATFLQWHLMALVGKNTPLPFTYIDKLQKLVDGDYALGWMLKKNSQSDAAILFHLGETDGFTTFTVLDQKGHSGVFALTNTENEDDAKPWVSTLLEKAAIELYVGVAK